MDNDKIVKLFREDDEPALSAAAKVRIVNAAVAEFERSRPEAMRFGIIRSRPAMALLAAAFAALLVVVFRPHPVEPTIADRQRAVLAEFNEVFGARLQAIINTDGKTQVVLAEGDQPHQGQPLHIHLSGPGHDVDIVSFSGENVSLSLGGKQVSFDALVDGKGGVILAGDRVFWHDGKGDVADSPGLKIDAHALEM